MHPRTTSCVLTAVLAAMGAEAAFAAPADFKLLSLVPPGAQVVSGFNARQNAYQTGGASLLLLTVNSDLDLQDWVALSGVDSRRGFSEVILVSMASPGATLSEHLLLVTGKFDRERIFRAAEMNGAKPMQYLGEHALAIDPFTRERIDMKATRWLAILDNRIVVFGTPWMVQQALDRFENRVQADPVLTDRLAMFGNDVTCWNVLASIPKDAQSVFLDSRGPWSALFKGTELLMLGIHGGSKVRVDVMMRTNAASESSDLEAKIADFGRIFVPELVREQDRIRRVSNPQTQENQMRASIVLSAEDFLAWKNGQRNRDKEVLHMAHEKQRTAASPDPPRTMSAFPPPGY